MNRKNESGFKQVRTMIFDYYANMLNRVRSGLDRHLDSVGGCRDVYAAVDVLYRHMMMDASIVGPGENDASLRERLAWNLDLLADAVRDAGDDPKIYYKCLNTPSFAELMINRYLVRGALYFLIGTSARDKILRAMDGQDVQGADGRDA